MKEVNERDSIPPIEKEQMEGLPYSITRHDPDESKARTEMYRAITNFFNLAHGLVNHQLINQAKKLEIRTKEKGKKGRK